MKKKESKELANIYKKMLKNVTLKLQHPVKILTPKQRYWELGDTVKKREVPE